MGARRYAPTHGRSPGPTADTREPHPPTPLLAGPHQPPGPERRALRLRTGDPAMVARVGGGRVLLDPRTLALEDFPAAAAALAAAAEPGNLPQ